MEISIIDSCILLLEHIVHATEYDGGYCTYYNITTVDGLIFISDTFKLN